jgi:hypothetical protein
MDLLTSPSGAALSAARRARLSVALPLLREAFEDAQELGRDPWQFAVTDRALTAAGLIETDLRWLVAHGYANHAVERSRPDACRRDFRPAGNLVLCDRSCFVLTDSGVALSGGLLPAASSDPVSAPRPAGGGSPADRPIWDVSLRELHWRGRLVKRFRSPAVSQEIILAAFQEEGWPQRIDDPLARPSGADPRQRLHDAIRGLNRNQRERLLRFRGDGTGQGIFWLPVPAGPGDPE